MTADQTHFGFKPVSPSEKTAMVGDVFHRVANQYDLMNDVMSGGLHRHWKQILVQRMDAHDRAHLVDVAGGTGDIAWRFLEAYPSCSVTLCDINPRMIEVGRDRCLNQGRVKGVSWIAGDASSLPLAADHFDFYSIAFGLRNVTFRGQALKEAFRILKPGGRFFCLEFSKVSFGPLRALYECYSFKLIPRLGAFIAQDGPAYQYLVESIAQFPNQTILKQEISAVGFQQVTVENLMGGIVAIHSGVKP